VGSPIWLKYAIVTVPVLAFGVLGAIVLAVAGVVALRRRGQFARATRVPAIIASYRESTDSDGYTCFFPRVRGTRPSGEAFEFESSGSSLNPSPAPGTPVEVLIDADDPTKLWLRGHEWRALLPWMGIGGFLAVGGLGLAIAGLIFVLLSR